MELLGLFVPFLEILFIAFVINYLLSFFWNTRTMDLVFGFLVFLFIFVATRWLHLVVLERLMDYVVSVLPLAILIIFQPELRIALSKLSIISKASEEITEFEIFLESIATSVYHLANKNIGAIIVLENQDSLQEYADRSVLLDAVFSSELIESIFAISTPLHDGAVIMRGTTILSAATILPLADDSLQIVKSMGTRHRASLGISQQSDALVIVISEETGKVSLAREGIMTRGVKIDRFKGVVRSIFNPVPKKSIRNRWIEWKNKISEYIT